MHKQWILKSWNVCYMYLTLLHVFDITRLKFMLQSFKNAFVSYNFSAGSKTFQVSWCGAPRGGREAGIRPAGRWKWARGRNIEGAHCSINCTFVLVDWQILKTPIWNDQWCSMSLIIRICVLPLVGIYLVTNLHCISGLICPWSVGWMVSLLGLLAKIKV